MKNRAQYMYTVCNFCSAIDLNFYRLTRDASAEDLRNHIYRKIYSVSPGFRILTHAIIKSIIK